MSEVEHDPKEPGTTIKTVEEYLAYCIKELDAADETRRQVTDEIITSLQEEGLTVQTVTPGDFFRITSPPEQITPDYIRQLEHKLGITDQNYVFGKNPHNEINTVQAFELALFDIRGRISYERFEQLYPEFRPETKIRASAILKSKQDVAEWNRLVEKLTAEHPQYKSSRFTKWVW